MHTPSRYIQIRAFARHYAEMILAMFFGMALLLPAGAALSAAGVSVSGLEEDAPAAMLLTMAVAMTVPMVAWMRHRGHGWAASAEMSAAMFVPTFAGIGLMAGGIVGYGDAMMLEHVAMFPAMLLVMLWRRDEYTGHAHHAAAVVA